ncbi:MAG TPA: ABC transporter ATP-binding protein [Acidobacteriaceae bacterium]|nr:ABC transporter ATP-binding protein [Acidobacteriaceae bacterium]
MPDKKTSKQPAPPKPAQDDDVAGKAYDARLMRRLLTYLSPYKLQVAISAVATILKSATDSIGPLLVMIAVDVYMSATPPAHLPWLARHLHPASPFQGITYVAALYLGALLFTFALELLQTYLMQWTGQKVMFDLRSQIFRHLQRLSPAFYDRNPVGRLVTRLTSDVDALNEMFTSGVLAIFEDIFTLAFIVAIMTWKSWPLALLTLAVIPAILFVTGIFRRSVRESYRRQRAATAKINTFTQEYVSGMSIVQLFNRERRAFADFSAVNSENKQAWTDAIFAYAWYYPVVELLSSAAIALVLWRGGTAVLHNQSIFNAAAQLGLHPARVAGIFGTVTIGVLIGFIQYAQRFFRPIQDLSEKYNILQAAMAASERVFKLLDTQPTIVSPTNPITAPPTGSIEFRNVWFTYQPLTEAQQAALSTSSKSVILSEAKNPRISSTEPTNSGAPFMAQSHRDMSGNANSSPATSHPSSESVILSERSESKDLRFPTATDLTTGPFEDIEWILRGVSFTIHPGETAAIVGHTGAGKTTIISLMMRFYDIQHGQILIDGVDIRDQDLTTLRRRFGVVLQDPFLFTGTIADNIRLGSTWITDQALQHAAEEVNIADFIRTQPLGFNQPMQERGATLSTGQKQLISFARALAHSPAILILDEATSSVDTDTEHRVRLALSRMITGRTSVLIAHRLSTVQSADTILVMHKGQLREHGTHQQLLTHRGLYYKLYQLQYRDQELTTPV